MEKESRMNQMKILLQDKLSEKLLKQKNCERHNIILQRMLSDRAELLTELLCTLFSKIYFQKQSTPMAYFENPNHFQKW